MSKEKNGSNIGFLTFLLSNLFNSIHQDPAANEKALPIAEELKRVAAEIFILAIAFVGACVIMLLPSTREEENEEYPEPSR